MGDLSTRPRPEASLRQVRPEQAPSTARSAGGAGWRYHSQQAAALPEEASMRTGPGWALQAEGTCGKWKRAAAGGRGGGGWELGFKTERPRGNEKRSVPQTDRGKEQLDSRGVDGAPGGRQTVEKLRQEGGPKRGSQGAGGGGPGDHEVSLEPCPEGRVPAASWGNRRAKEGVRPSLSATPSASSQVVRTPGFSRVAVALRAAAGAARASGTAIGPPQHSRP